MSTASYETSLQEEQILDIIHTAAEKLFPKDCASCGRSYSSIKEYLMNTVHLGQPRSYDADMQDWQPNSPLGTFSFSQCKCGNTITLSSSRVVDTETMWQLLSWVKKEAQRREIPINELLNELRAKMNAQVLNSHE